MSAPVGGAVRHSAGFTHRPAAYFDLIAPEDDLDAPPMMLVHGGAHTGACYLTTPDGRPGWAYRFVQRGYRVAVPDWPGVGRSGHIPLAELTTDVVVAGLGSVLDRLERPAVVVTHSMGGALGWKLLEQHGALIDRIVAVAPGPPGNLETPTVFLDETDDVITLQGIPGGPEIAVDRRRPFAAPLPWVEQKLVGLGTRFPRRALAPYNASLQALPPQLLLERLNHRGRAPRVQDFRHYVGRPVLVLSATHDPEHTPALDRPIVDWLNHHGAHAEHCCLGDIGVDGNGHMMMLEDNSDLIAGLIADWLEASPAGR